jgi:hypothetical protein
MLHIIFRLQTILSLKKAIAIKPSEMSKIINQKEKEIENNEKVNTFEPY